MAKNSTTAIVRQQVGPRQVDFKMPMRGGGGGVQAGDWVENLLAGGTASTLSKIILQPFDTSKTLLQVGCRLKTCSTKNKSLAGIGSVPMPLEKFHVLWHADGGRRLLVS